MKSAAKVLHQTAKTCQYIKENAKNCIFFEKSDLCAYIKRPQGCCGRRGRLRVLLLVCDFEDAVGVGWSYPQWRALCFFMDGYKEIAAPYEGAAGEI